MDNHAPEAGGGRWKKKERKKRESESWWRWRAGEDEVGVGVLRELGGREGRCFVFRVGVV